MKIEIDSTFEEFNEELNKKIEAILNDPLLSTSDKKEKIRDQRKLSYSVASKCFYEETKNLLIKMNVFSTFDNLFLKINQVLGLEKIRYNIYDNLSVIQIMKPGDLQHHKLVEAEILADAFFNITKESKQYNLLLGFIEDRKVNEILQLCFYIYPGLMRP